MPVFPAIRVLTKSDDCAAGVCSVFHEYDYRPNLTTRSEHRSPEFEGMRFDSSWGIGIFSLSHARDKTKNIFL